ncbi:MAG: hypothetical protein GXY16_00380 [Syntrophomonadaceae bacterium]|nr:hypothetical protein [Syntrophomonadaceae bacterium]
MTKNSDMVNFAVRLIFKDTRAIDLDKMADTTRRSMFDLLRIHVKKIEIKRYGLLLTGKGPIQEILRVGENFYVLTNEGGLEIVVHINDSPVFYMKEGRIHDLMKENEDIVIPKFDDAEPDEGEFNRLGI